MLPSCGPVTECAYVNGACAQVELRELREAPFRELAAIKERQV
jgi:hypothetical protein